MKKITLKIDGMHCISCAISIEGVLEDTEGVHEAKTNYARSECHVEYDEKKVKPRQIIKHIKETGYSSYIME
jgi:copper chaperone CopZ